MLDIKTRDATPTPMAFRRHHVAFRPLGKRIAGFVESRRVSPVDPENRKSPVFRRSRSELRNPEPECVRLPS